MGQISYSGSSLQQALHGYGFVHVRGRESRDIVKLMRTVNGLAVKEPTGGFQEFGSEDWELVAGHVNRCLHLHATAVPKVRPAKRPQASDVASQMEAADRRVVAARSKLNEFPRTLCWRGQFPDGTDKPDFGKLHYVDRKGLRTLCGRNVPQNLWCYEDTGVEECSACNRIHDRLEDDLG